MKNIIFAVFQISVLTVICFHGESFASSTSSNVNSTSPSAPSAPEKTVTSEDLRAMKRQILESLNKLEKLMDRVNNILVPARSINQSGSSQLSERQGGTPLGMLGDIYKDLSDSFLQSMRSMQYHVTRLMAASPLCSYPMRAVDPDPETAPFK